MARSRFVLGVSVLWAGFHGFAAAAAGPASVAPAAAPVTPAAVETSKFDITRFAKADVGFATVQFNALIQAWAVGNEHASATDQNLRLRRAELKLSGLAARTARYQLMVDPARLIAPPGGKPISADRMIADFFASYGAGGFELTAGQFKIPTTAEALDSSTDLPLPERSVLGRTLGYRREMGVRLAYKTQLWNLSSMLSTGHPITEASTGPNTFNDLDTRFELTPAKGVSFGTFAVLGNDFKYASKGRWGLNGRYRLGDAVALVEYGAGTDLGAHSQGVTSELGYWITERFEPVARFETFNPGKGFGADAMAETLGVNYYFRDYYAKMQLAGSLMQNMTSPNGSPTPAKGVHNEEITLEVQASI